MEPSPKARFQMNSCFPVDLPHCPAFTSILGTEKTGVWMVAALVPDDISMPLGTLPRSLFAAHWSLHPLVSWLPSAFELMTKPSKSNNFSVFTACVKVECFFCGHLVFLAFGCGPALALSFTLIRSRFKSMLLLDSKLVSVIDISSTSFHSFFL